MKRNILVVLILIISVGVGFQFLTNDKSSLAENYEEDIQQEVKIQVSALKKSASQKTQLKAAHPNELQISQNILDVVELQDLNQLKTTLGTNFKQTLKKQNISSEALDAYIENFNFEDEFAYEYKKLHQDDVHAIYEALNHPLSKKLKTFEEKAQQEVMDYLKNGSTRDLDPVKGNLIREILVETNAMEQSLLMVRELLASTYTTAILKSNQKATMAEARSQGRKLATQVAQAQAPVLNKAFEYTYDKLSASELEEYLFFMQKVDARKATELNLGVAGRVMTRYFDGLVGIIIDAKQSETP